MHPLEAYLRELHAIHASGAGVRETSYYPALKNLLDAVGGELRPRVQCIIHLRSTGAGIPDGGLFTADQLKRAPDDPLAGQLPARAVIEVKGAAEDVGEVARSEQVAKYLARYGLALVTNLRDFQLVRPGRGGRPKTLETYRLAESEAAFWAAAAAPRAAVEAHGERLVEYLRRVMLASAPLSKPEDVAWFLASYARDAKARVAQADLPALAAVRRALEDALGLAFEGEAGDHFFRSTLVQTLFYGVFSAWVLWHGEDPERDDRFDWRLSAYYLRLPVMQALFEQVGDPSKLRALGLVEVLDWTGATLGRVVRRDFFAAFERGQAVQYFYEPFLKAFDPELRKSLGVWYTPPEVVRYMVARVDGALRTELGVADGLADPRVVVLDPCAGTGAYLVEVLRRIAATLEARGEGALLGGLVKRAALGRVYGFEILPAPYVVAHLQLGLLLQQLHAPLAEGERAGMFLTNALTGWEGRQVAERRPLPGFPELEAERDAAEHVKREAEILVVLGNPPYNAFAGVSPAEEKGLVEPYKAGLIREWGIKKFNLDDLYIRFFRLAERRIAEQTGRGIVCYISNFSYLGDPSFVVMRRRFLTEFDALWFDCLNGDSRETGKLTPEGKPDPSVFSTDMNPAGIRVGTAIGLMARKSRRDEQPVVRFRHFWGAKKRAELEASLAEADFDAAYDVATPVAGNRWSFRPGEVGAEYEGWARLTELCATAPVSGLKENRGFSMIGSDRQALEARMRAYYDSQVQWSQLKSLGTGLTENAARFDARETRNRVLVTEGFDSSRIFRYVLRPFETKWCYWSSVRPLWNEPRPALVDNYYPGNQFFICRPSSVVSPEGTPFFMASHLVDFHSLRGQAHHFPISLHTAQVQGHGKQVSLFDKRNSHPLANLSPPARAYLTALALPDPDADPDTAALIWMHALAIGYSPAYLLENADGIRQDWPRVPLPSDRERLLASAALGRQIAALLDTEAAVEGVTGGGIRPELRGIAVVSQTEAGPLDLAVTAGWGHGGKAGVTMPGKGRLVARERAPGERGDGLGDTTFDVYLNERTYWRNVPARVWEYTIGGYQVIKKWLSYREAKLLGRALTHDEAAEVRDTARRIAAIVLLEPELDANYAAAKAGAWGWRGRGGDEPGSSGTL